jgi:hypothetical protein
MVVSHDATTLANSYVAKAGGTMTGPLSIPDPTNSTHAVNRKTLDAAVAAAIPRGVITMWSGLATAVPAGWAFCDGKTPGVPDLTDKFIVAARDGNEGSTGGQDSVTLLTVNLPSHNHSVPTITVTSGNNDVSHAHSGTTGYISANHTHAFTSNGASTSHTHTGTVSVDDRDHVHGGVPKRAVHGIHSGGALDMTRFDAGTVNTRGRNTGHHHTFTSSGFSNSHVHGGRTGTVSANHTHNFTTGTQSANHKHTITIPTRNTGNTGSGTSFDNRPKYYALAYIMKL